MGCKVGPNYTPPPVLLPRVTIEDRPEKTCEVDDAELTGWWSRFRDPSLDHLLELAIARNFDYRSAIAAVCQARAEYWINWTYLLPEFDATGIGTRYRVSETFIPPNGLPLIVTKPVQSFYQTGLDALWQFDIFGKYRRQTAAAYDLWEASVEEMRGVKITMISEVVNTYATIRAYQKKREIALEAVKLDEELVSLSRDRFRGGLVDEQQVLGFFGSLEGDRAELAVIESGLKQYIYALSILCGTIPEVIVDEFDAEGPLLTVEGCIPVGLPSDLLRRRPDIRNAERQLAAATEQIGVAVADLFPTLALTGSSSSYASNPLQGANIGYSTSHLKDLFKPASLIWGVGGLVIAPILDFGKRRAAIDVQIALRDQAYFAYQKSVVGALQETEQVLQAYFHEQERKRSLSKQVEANARTLSLTTNLYEAGLTDFSQVLQVKEAWLVSLNTLTDSEQALAVDLVGIYKALGGHW